MKQFIVTLKHDAGQIKIRVIASNEEDAKRKVCIAENCPESAIVRVSRAFRKRIS